MECSDGYGGERCPEGGDRPTGDPSGVQEQDRADGGPGDGDHGGQRPQHQGDRSRCPEQESAFIPVGGAVHEAVGHRGGEGSKDNEDHGGQRESGVHGVTGGRRTPHGKNGEGRTPEAQRGQG